MQVGDIIVIPGKNSDHVAIAKIESTVKILIVELLHIED